MHALTIQILVVVGGILAVAPLLFLILARSGRASEKLMQELWARWKSWLILAPILIVPILLGRVTTILAFVLLGLACHWEYARATGHFRDRILCWLVVFGILLTGFSALDHWYGFFVAIPPLMISLLALGGLQPDKPSGYLQRVALAGMAFLFFGMSFGHLAYMANDRYFQPLLLIILLCTELNDVFAYVFGKLFGGPKMAPNTSPNKTLSGALLAMVAVTLLFVWLARPIFAGSPLDFSVHLVVCGVLLAITAQFGDLVISSIKRDLGIKDMGSLIPGHGGLLDRFDSLLFVGPALFHYIGYFRGIGLDMPTNVIMGG